jgi:hypothetical protein
VREEREALARWEPERFFFLPPFQHSALSLSRSLAGWLAWHSRYGEVGTFITRKWQESSAAAVVAAAASLENGIENKNILPLKVYQAKWVLRMESARARVRICWHFENSHYLRRKKNSFLSSNAHTTHCYEPTKPLPRRANEISRSSICAPRICLLE